MGKQTLDSTGGPAYSSIALDSDDNPHISYYDETNYDLKYARRRGTPMTWVADLNEDGTKDVIAGYNIWLDVSRYSSILATDGFTGETLWTYNITNHQIRYLTLGDFNNDGIPDIASIHRDTVTDQDVLVILEGSYGTPILVFITPELALDKVASDFNMDGKVDIAIGTSKGKVYIIQG